MAKKDLSQAKGLDALFNSAPTITRQDPVVSKPVAKKKNPPKAKAVEKKVEKKEVVKEAPIVEEIEVKEEIQEVEQVEKQQIRSRKPRDSKKQEQKQQIFSVNLEGVRKRKIEYTGIRLKKDLFDRLETIASKEKLKSTNSLIAIVLEAYCEGYEA